MQNAEYSVALTHLVDKLKLENCTPNVPIEDVKVTQSDVNRPALQLAGFFDYFDSNRIQIIGQVEYTYMEQKGVEYSVQMLEEILCGNEKSPKPPCIVFCRNLPVDDRLIELATKYQVPILRTKRATNEFMADLIQCLNYNMAPRCTVHGVLVDIYGEGILIMGESGIGKSEAALELIKRGHRLVTDDVVEIRKVSDETLVGSAPDVTKNFIELRGIGIVDVKSMFGVQSVRETQNIDLVITLEDWSREKEYDRLGLEEEYTEFLGNKVVCHSIPIRPGRNLAIIVESAAVNHRQKQMGYNAAQELYKRVQENLAKKR